MFKVGRQVTVVGDSRVWVITAVHNTDPPTYDLALVGDAAVTQHNVPEGDMIIATGN